MGRLSPEQTEALAEAVFDFQTEADLAAWLAALPGDKTSSNEREGLNGSLAFPQRKADYASLTRATR